MIRFLLLCTVFPCLAGCLTWPVTARDTVSAVPTAAAVGQYHFGWKLSGNRAVAPLQIFDDGHRTWLQFPTGQPVPVIFARLPQGDQLLTATAGRGGLLMLDGVWPQLILRGGALQSTAQRLPTGVEVATGVDRLATEIVSAPASVMMPVTAPVASSAVATVASPIATPSPVGVTTAMPLSPATPSTPPSESTSPSSVEPTSQETVFRVSPADATLRAALSRWANMAGWTFAFSHWAVEVDIPIVAAATFTQPFEQAVQELVASTELSDQPLRPCFYTNRVLRIVPHTRLCDHRAGAGG